MHSAEISRANPTCFVFLLDQSRSTEEGIGGEDSTRSKQLVVADAIAIEASAIGTTLND
jgi:hypothetical protein